VSMFCSFAGLRAARMGLGSFLFMRGKVDGRGTWNHGVYGMTPREGSRWFMVDEEV